MEGPFDADMLAAQVRDGVYVAVGLGVLSYQRSRIARRRVAEVIGSQVNEVEDRFDEVCEQVERRLPSPVAEVLAGSRRMGRTSRARLLGLPRD